jgi:hypothetical protein
LLSKTFFETAKKCPEPADWQGSGRTDSLAAGCTGRAPGGARFQARLDIESHVGMEFHGDRFRFIHEVRFHQEGVSVDFVHAVVVFLLIQSKGQAWPASACGHVDPDRGHFFACEVHIELLFGSLGQFKHGILL